MTREEEIIEAGIDYTMSVHPMCLGGLAFEEDIRKMNRNKSFEEGAKWADSHPNLSEEEQVGMGGLGMIWQKKALINKACKWLKDQEEMIGISFEEDFIERFKEAMEEQL